jgi:hypothetical protein
MQEGTLEGWRTDAGRGGIRLVGGLDEDLYLNETRSPPLDFLFIVALIVV